MQNVKFQTLPPEFVQACENIRKARQLTTEAKKLDESGKAYLADFLKANRGIDLAKLEIGEMVCVNSGELTIQIAKQSRFDTKGFAIADPETYSQWVKEFPTIKFNI